MIIVISTIVIAILGKHIVFFLVVFLMGPIHSYAAPIHDFVRAGNLEKLKKFISENPEPLKTVNMLDEETGESPLHIAAARGDFEATLFLLSAGADPRSTTPSLSREAPILPILEAPVTSVDIQPIVSGLSKFADRGKPPVLCREESSSEPIPTSPFTLESYSGEGAHDYYRGFCHGLEKAITVWKER